MCVYITAIIVPWRNTCGENTCPPSPPRLLRLFSLWWDWTIPLGYADCKVPTTKDMQKQDPTTKNMQKQDPTTHLVGMCKFPPQKICRSKIPKPRPGNPAYEKVVRQQGVTIKYKVVGTERTD